MAGQLIPLPEFATTLPDDLTREQWVQVWMDHMDSCEQFLLAGLRREAGPEGDLENLYRQWYRRAMDDHDQAMYQMLEQLSAVQGIP